MLVVVLVGAVAVELACVLAVVLAAVLVELVCVSDVAVAAVVAESGVPAAPALPSAITNQRTRPATRAAPPASRVRGRMYELKDMCVASFLELQGPARIATQSSCVARATAHLRFGRARNSNLGLAPRLGASRELGSSRSPAPPARGTKARHPRPPSGAHAAAGTETRAPAGREGAALRTPALG